MCRVLSYLGKPLTADELLYKSDNSLIKQTYDPQYMSHLLNLAGFGLVAWDSPKTIPYIYKTDRLPFYDENLRNLAKKINPTCLLAHIRGVSYNEKQVVSELNVHPFKFPETDIVLAHNGSLAEFEKIKYDLLDYIAPIYQKNIHGTTDSEWIYAILISQLIDIKTDYQPNDIVEALLQTLRILQKVRRRHRIAITSPVNLFISNGEFIAATRFVLDYGWNPSNMVSTHFAYHSLWYTYGDSYGYHDNEYQMKDGAEKSSIIISSEPLTHDVTTWIEIPEYSLLMAYKKDNKINILSHDITL